MNRQTSLTWLLQWTGKSFNPLVGIQLINASRPVQTARMSLQHVPYAQHYTRLSLVAEAPSPQPDEWEGSQRTSYIQIEKSEKRTSQYIQGEDNSPVGSGLPERANSEPEIFAPIRRRSLLQHGIATRKSWVENDSRQSLPSQLPSNTSRDDLQNYYYNPAKPTSSPLSSIAALGPKYDDNSPGPRTMTPDDLDYGHIGAYKLGSLRITNGTTSPSPSHDRPGTRTDDVYFVDGRGSAHSNRAAPRVNTISTTQDIRTPWITRAESPLRQTQAQDLEDEPLSINTHLPMPEFSAFQFNTDSPTKSLDLAREYMQDLALSPFSFDNSPPRTPLLEATSKHTAVEDDLFEVDSGSPVEIPERREFRSFDSGYRGEDAQAEQTDLAPQPLAKADSGYSSKVSLRSFKGTPSPAVPAKEAPPTPPKEPVSRAVSSAYSMTSSYSEVSEMAIKFKRSLPALPKDIPPPSRQAPPVPLKHSAHNVIPAPPLPHKSPEQQSAAGSSRPQVIAPSKHVRQQSLLAVPQSLRDEFVPSHSPAGSTGSSTSSTSTSRLRKYKKRSQCVQPQPVYNIQAVPASADLSVPAVPVEKARHLEKRVYGFPVASFPNTLTSSNNLRRTISNETLGTIFSVGSAEYKDVPTFARLQSALPPVPVHDTNPEDPTPEVNRRYQPSPASPSAAETRNRSILQTVPNRATPQSQQAFENHITSYDGVSASLGKSPYDVALRSMARQPTVQERAKSITSQLEAEARERLARVRSLSEEPTISPQEHLQRRLSYDSIAKQSPFSSTISSRQLPQERPPQVHTKWSGAVGGAQPPGALV